MFRATAHPIVRRRRRVSRRNPTVCVVDPKTDDYQGWQSSAHSSGVQLHFVASADEALRLARTAAVDLWVVNTDLPGIAGAPLCSMLRQQSGQAAIYLVSERNSPELERTAWAARPTLFGCKGEHHAWLAQWLDHFQHRPASPLVS